MSLPHPEVCLESLLSDRVELELSSHIIVLDVATDQLKLSSYYTHWSYLKSHSLYFKS